MRNPNGYGSVKKLSGNRRRPYAALITTGWTEEGKQIQKYLGYYAKRSDAMAALSEYHTNPYDLTASTVTFSEIYNIVFEQYVSKQSHSSVNGYRAAYKHAADLYQMPFSSIKASHLQAVIDNSGVGYASRNKIKVLFATLYKYAMANDIVSKDYSKFVDTGKREKPNINRQVFTADEIDRLFKHAPANYADCVLIMIYTGFRIGELLDLKNADINFESGFIRGGKKTAAGKDRLVPIHPKILPFIQARYNPENEYLILNPKGKPMTYSNFVRDHFEHLMEQLGMDHHTHDCRHTFFTALDNAGANKTAVKKIGGHASYQTTEKYYTHKDLDELKKAIALLG